MNKPQPISFFFSYIEERSAYKYYPYFLAIILVLISWLFSYPSLTSFDSSSPGWQTVLLKSRDLTNSLSHLDPSDWTAKKVFRLTLPFLIKMFHLSPLMIIIIQGFVGYLIYIFSFKITLRISNDEVQATFLTAGLAFLYFGRAAYFDFNYTWFDAFAYFFLVMAIYCRNLILIFLFSTFAAWTDERAFIALSIVFLYHAFNDDKLKQKFNLNHVFSLNPKALIVLLASVSYLVVRAFLHYGFNMHTPTDGANLGIIAKTYRDAPIGIWTFLEGFWIIYLLSLFSTFKDKDYFKFSLFMIPLSVLTVVSICVTDITRSGSYLVPMIFVLLKYLNLRRSRKQLRYITLLCFTLSFLFPAIVVCSDWPSWNFSTLEKLPNLIEKILNY